MWVTHNFPKLLLQRRLMQERVHFEAQLKELDQHNTGWRVTTQVSVLKKRVTTQVSVLKRSAQHWLEGDESGECVE